MNASKSAPSSYGRLILVPNTLDLGTQAPDTPFPSLQDTLPLQALHLASQLKFWVAENAKTTRAFLKRVDAIAPLQTTLQAIDIQTLPKPNKGGAATIKANETSGANPWAAMLAPALQGHDIGLISEAGLPGVADPGSELVWAAHQAGIQVLPLSGPSALVLAISGSGLNGQSFAFQGYLPTDSAQRAERIQALEMVSRKQKQTQLVIETPYRNAALFDALLKSLNPQTRLCVACGLTLTQGWCKTHRVAQWRQQTVTWPDNIPCVFAWLAEA